LNSLYKAEVITQAPGWEGLDDVETATADWVGWFNHERLHSMLDYRTPTEVEAQYWAGHTGPDQTATAA
jgi:putative transposase